ncbi:MAG: NAD-dependent epimerase/dehydratase family protein, partial [Bacteroidota bacterium]
MASDKILVTGALGQLGTELSFHLGEVFGFENVILSDIREPDSELFADYRFEKLNVLDQNNLAEIIQKYDISQIYHLAAVLSANAERNPLKSWQINLEGSLNILEAGRVFSMDKIYIPSSIAAFGPNTPKDATPQYTSMDPNTVYGISKLSAELWGQYYFNRYQLDVRSLRYPGIISYKTLPGGGTTDYAVDIFYQALENESYNCFLDADTFLPMVYMPD